MYYNVLYLHHQNNNNMTNTKKQFTIYKKGTTEEPITIVSVEGQPFDRDKKIDFYQKLGYTVKLIDAGAEFIYIHKDGSGRTPDTLSGEDIMEMAENDSIPLEDIVAAYQDFTGDDDDEGFYSSEISDWWAVGDEYNGNSFTITRIK